ncbi:hypothetical protein V5799_016875 [Amblyomma americanum]|uniref:Secreted protein n=1 Tax=Amblyomma americanum TaxID=6943 RepID=A0AAQ4F4N0_AMBAM
MVTLCALLFFLVSLSVIGVVWIGAAQGPETLLCTYGQRTTEDAVMAEDGLCDYAFYDSMYANDKNTLVDQGKFGQDLQTFMRAADRYNSTALGLAFAFEHIGEASAHLRKAGQYPLETFWRMKIFHVGVLDASDFSTGIDMQVSIWLLKVIHDYASAKGHTVVTALAAPSPERHWAEFLAHLGRYVPQTTVFIAQSILS